MHSSLCGKCRYKRMLCLYHTSVRHRGRLETWERCLHKDGSLERLFLLSAYEELQWCRNVTSSLLFREYWKLFYANSMAADKEKAKIRVLWSGNFLYLLSFHQPYFLKVKQVIGKYKNYICERKLIEHFLLVHQVSLHLVLVSRLAATQLDVCV